MSMPIYLRSIRVPLSVEFCLTHKTYLKGAPFYNAWGSLGVCGISKRGGKVGFLTFPPRGFSIARRAVFFSAARPHRDLSPSPAKRTFHVRSQPDISWISDTGVGVPVLLQGRILRLACRQG